MLPPSHRIPDPVQPFQIEPASRRPCDPGREPLLRRVRAEYVEMPGLRLTAAQAARFLGVAHAECAALLDALVAEGFLRHRDGRYLRPDAA